MARPGFWYPEGGQIVAVLLYSGSDWQTVSGASFLPALPEPAASRMLPEEEAAREAGTLRAVIGAAPWPPGITSGQLDAYLPVAWAWFKEHDPNG